MLQMNVMQPKMYKQNCQYYLFTEWGPIILKGSLNPFPDVSSTSKQYIYMYVFFQGCACPGVPKGEACAECFLKSKANIGG